MLHDIAFAVIFRKNKKVAFGVGALLEKPFKRMYGEEIIAGGTYFFAGLICCLIKERIVIIEKIWKIFCYLIYIILEFPYSDTKNYFSYVPYLFNCCSSTDY